MRQLLKTELPQSTADNKSGHNPRSPDPKYGPGRDLSKTPDPKYGPGRDLSKTPDPRYGPGLGLSDPTPGERGQGRPNYPPTHPGFSAPNAAYGQPSTSTNNANNFPFGSFFNGVRSGTVVGGNFNLFGEGVHNQPTTSTNNANNFPFGLLFDNNGSLEVRGGTFNQFHGAAHITPIGPGRQVITQKLPDGTERKIYQGPNGEQEVYHVLPNGTEKKVQ